MEPIDRTIPLFPHNQKITYGTGRNHRKIGEVINALKRQTLIVEGTRLTDMRLKIQEAAETVGVSAQTIRKWERNGLVHCARFPNGFRYFMAQDIERLRLIKELLGRGTRMTAVRQLVGEMEGGTGGSPVHLAGTLIALRMARGWTLDEVANRAGLSPMKIHTLENGRSNGSIEILQRLASVYGVALIDLVRGQVGRDPEVVRASERPRLVTGGDSITMEGLAQGDVDLRPMRLTVDPGRGVDTFHGHPGQEFIYVLVGELVVELHNGRTYTLESGDSMAFRSEILHRWHATDHILQALWIHRDRERGSTHDAL